MARPRNPLTPPLPVVTLQRKYHTKARYDVVARIGDRVVKAWDWWMDEKPRSLRARVLVLEGKRYAVRYA